MVHRAVESRRLAQEIAPRFPGAFGHLLCAIDFHSARVREVALVGSAVGPLLEVVRERYRPHVVLAAAEEATDTSVALLEGRKALGGAATAYVCEHFSCQAPVSDPAALRSLLG